MTLRQPAAAITLPTESANDDPVLKRSLPSGRSLVLRTEASGEEIEIRSARGELELRIALTDAGPVVTLREARLEVAAPELVFRCRSFDVQASDSLNLRCEREVRIESDELRARTEHDIHLNGAYVRINCTPDLQVPVDLSALTTPTSGAGTTEPHECGDACHAAPHEPPKP